MLNLSPVDSKRPSRPRPEIAMPIYEYQCAACGGLHEALQKISDPPLTDCPACGKATLRKKVSAVAFRLKGSGWYETDFKSGDKKNLAGDSDGAKSASSEGGGDAPGGGDAGAKSGRESESRNKDDNKSENNNQNKPRGSAKSADKTPAGPASPAGGAAQS